MAGAQKEHAGPHLRAALTLPALAIYAIGDILGAGIYALVGKVAAVCGPGLWVAFIVSGIVALLTGLAYAEMGSRYPRSAGAALYCRRGFGHPLPAFVVGVFVLVSGITSAAAVSRAMVGYLHQFVLVPELPASLAFLALASFLSFWGIEASSRVNMALTAVEASGLVLVAVAGFAVASRLSGAEIQLRLEPSPDNLQAVFAGATIAFFAFIGFEDIANVAEEVRDPRRTIPRAIIIAICCTVIMYLLIGVAALVAVPTHELAESAAPLASVVAASGIRVPGGLFAIVAIFAIVNTGLLNLIMAARLSYGMASEGLLPPVLARVHPRRRTPAVAVIVVLVLAALLSVSGGVRVLAQTTSFLLMIVFLAVHVSLLLVKRREPLPPEGVFRVPRVVPLAGVASCVWMVFQYPAGVYVRATAAAIAAVVFYWVAGRSATLPADGDPRPRASS